MIYIDQERAYDKVNILCCYKKNHLNNPTYCPSIVNNLYYWLFLNIFTYVYFLPTTPISEFYWLLCSCYTHFFILLILLCFSSFFNIISPFQTLKTRRMEIFLPIFLFLSLTWIFTFFSWIWTCFIITSWSLFEFSPYHHTLTYSDNSDKGSLPSPSLVLTTFRTTWPSPSFSSSKKNKRFILTVIILLTSK